MVNFAYGALVFPTPPPVSAWTGIGLSWVGWDGSVWPLTKPRSGRFLQPGVRGLLRPDYTRHSTSSAAVPGSRHRGTSTNDREVFWPLYEYSDVGSEDFLKWRRAFWRTMDPDRGGVWRAELPGGEVRTLGLKYVSCPDGMFNDPLRSGWMKSQITLVAEKPYWRGVTVRQAWGQTAPKNFYVTAEDRVTYGWPDDVIYYLSTGSKIGSATFTNAGDVQAYPVWTVVGPTTDVTFGVGGATVQLPMTIPDGYAVQIDTDPVEGQVLWYGAWDAVSRSLVAAEDRTSYLDPGSKFVAIPAGENRQLSITMTGTGSVMAELTALYREAL